MVLADILEQAAQDGYLTVNDPTLAAEQFLALTVPLLAADFDWTLPRGFPKPAIPAGGGAREAR